LNATIISYAFVCDICCFYTILNGHSQYDMLQLHKQLQAHSFKVQMQLAGAWLWCENILDFKKVETSNCHVMKWRSVADMTVDTMHVDRRIYHSFTTWRL